MGASISAMSAVPAVIQESEDQFEDSEQTGLFFKVAKVLLGWTNSTLSKTGAVGWIVGTSLMVLVVPAVLDITRQIENDQKQQDMIAFNAWQQQQAGSGAGSVLDTASLGNVNPNPLGAGVTLSNLAQAQ